MPYSCIFPKGSYQQLFIVSIVPALPFHFNGNFSFGWIYAAVAKLAHCQQNIPDPTVKKGKLSRNKTNNFVELSGVVFSLLGK